MNREQALVERVAVAKKELDAADDKLARLLHEVGAASRSEKTKISRVVEDALGKLRAARDHLSDLERRLASDDE